MRLLPLQIARYFETMKVNPRELEYKAHRKVSALAINLYGEGMAWTCRMMQVTLQTICATKMFHTQLHHCYQESCISPDECALKLTRL